MFKAILWDNDGVLVDTEPLYFRATRLVLGGVGVHLTETLFRELFLTDSRGAWHLAKENGVPPHRIKLLREERDRIYSDMLPGRNYAIVGVESVLRSLRPYYTMAVVTSSWKRDFDEIHRSTDLLQYFDFVLTREDYTQSKPNPEPYLRALQILGVRTREALAIEDSERGLIAAKHAGLPCWVIPTKLTEQGDFSSAERVLKDVREVASLLSKKNEEGIREFNGGRPEKYDTRKR
jgi:HAD superfamily hydrolase (TIGR01509 family)